MYFTSFILNGFIISYLFLSINTKDNNGVGQEGFRYLSSCLK